MKLTQTKIAELKTNLLENHLDIDIVKVNENGSIVNIALYMSETIIDGELVCTPEYSYSNSFDKSLFTGIDHNDNDSLMESVLYGVKWYQLNEEEVDKEINAILEECEIYVPSSDEYTLWQMINTISNNAKNLAGKTFLIEF